MEYVRISDSTAQSLYAIRDQHPHTSIPEGADLLDMGYAPLSATEPPAYDALTQTVVRDGCELINGAWRYKWRIDALSAEQIEAKRLASIPQSVTRRQARQALLLAGLLSSVQAAIDGIADPIQRGLAQIEWDDSQAFERERPLLIALATALGLDSAELDQLFMTAAGL